ncbi:AAA family ATPase [Acinetobacter faecalis]|uniref:AAA family ATPase n=1 Tax=Acinetobacter faecalis TaxID=2665161 RepID=UPI002A9178E9|nr:AAA family ATPase [Acinetobacter faecalis]MDY6460035.1 AAA family ATPase [Acinetobacter faecalis]
MNFWHMQLHPNDKSAFNRTEIKNLLISKKVIGLGKKWDNDRGQPQKFSTVMQVGDIILIRSEGPLALVKVIGQCYENTDDSIWFDLIRDVEILSLDGNIYKNQYKAVFSSSWNDSLYLSTTIEVANSSKFIKFWYQDIFGKIEMDNAINLLSSKHQIVLQGPPGTGKTRLAKLIAEKLIQPSVIGSPEEIVDKLLREFDSSSNQVIAVREQHRNILTEFLEQFPKEQLNQLSLDQYCTGTGGRNNFCWWIERGLQPLGYYFPGSSRTYQIYWKKSTQEYSKHGFIKNVTDDDVAMKEVAQKLHNLVNQRNLDELAKYFGDSFMLKILNTYYPTEYFPINSEKMINHALKIFKVDYSALNVFDKNKKLYEIYINKKEKFNLDMTPFEFSNLLSSTFNLKEGKDITEKNEVISQGEYQIVQFHPAYSYEDFVRGIVAKTDENGNIAYNVENKVLAAFAKKAQDNPNGKYVLIIDEINRANLPSVLGELIYALEYRGEAVTTMYELEEDRQIILPKNLYIIGTMNTADRSVGHIDYAIRRRFAFVDVQPNETIIENQKAKNIFKYLDLLFKEHLSPDFKKDDVMIGHSYFLVQDDNQLRMKLDYEIKPILKEYLKDGILLDSAEVHIDNLKV